MKMLYAKPNVTIGSHYFPTEVSPLSHCVTQRKFSNWELLFPIKNLPIIKVVVLLQQNASSQ